MPQFDFGIGKEYTKVDVTKRKPAKNSIPVSSTELVKPRTTKKRGPSGKKGESLGLPPANRLTNPESPVSLSPDSRLLPQLSGERLGKQTQAQERQSDPRTIEWAGKEIDRIFGSDISPESRKKFISYLWSRADGDRVDTREGFKPYLQELLSLVGDRTGEGRKRIEAVADMYRGSREAYNPDPFAPKNKGVLTSKETNLRFLELGVNPRSDVSLSDAMALTPQDKSRAQTQDELIRRRNTPLGTPEDADLSTQNLLARSLIKSGQIQGKRYGGENDDPWSDANLYVDSLNHVVTPFTGLLRSTTGEALENISSEQKAAAAVGDFVFQLAGSMGLSSAGTGTVNAGRIANVLTKAGIPARYAPQVMRASSAIAHIGEQLPTFLAFDVPGYAYMIKESGGDVGKAAQLFGQGMVDGFNPAVYADPTKPIDEKVGAAINAVTGLMIGVGLTARAAGHVKKVGKPSQYATLTPTEIGSIKLAGDFLDSSGIQLPNEWIKKQAKTLVELRRAGIEDPETVARHMTLVEFASEKSGQSAAKSAAALLEGGQLDRAIPERVGENQAPEASPVAMDAPAMQTRPESQTGDVPETQGVNPFAIEELAPDRMSDQVPDTGNMVDAPRANVVPDEVRADFEDFRSMMEQEFSGDKSQPVDTATPKTDAPAAMDADTDPGSIFDPADAMQEPVEVTMPSAKPVEKAVAKPAVIKESASKVEAPSDKDKIEVDKQINVLRNLKIDAITRTKTGKLTSAWLETATFAKNALEPLKAKHGDSWPKLNEAYNGLTAEIGTQAKPKPKAVTVPSVKPEENPVIWKQSYEDYQKSEPSLMKAAEIESAVQSELARPKLGKEVRKAVLNRLQKQKEEIRADVIRASLKHSNAVKEALADGKLSREDYDQIHKSRYKDADTFTRNAPEKKEINPGLKKAIEDVTKHQMGVTYTLGNSGKKGVLVFYGEGGKEIYRTDPNTPASELQSIINTLSDQNVKLYGLPGDLAPQPKETGSKADTPKQPEPKAPESKPEQVQKTEETGGAKPEPKPKSEPVAKVDPGERVEDFGEKIGGARKDTSRKLGPRSEKLQDADAGEAGEESAGWRSRYRVAENVTREKGWFITDTRKKHSSWSSRKLYPTKEEAEAAIPLVAVSRNHTVRQRGDEFAIVRTTENGNLVVRGGFKTNEDAMKYMALNPAEIIEFKFPTLEKSRPQLDFVVRTGGDARKGSVKTSEFQSEFKFRAGEFGNWNMGGDGQAALNYAFDGLSDLAGVLGLTKDSVSLRGDLAIAFGARGKGGLNANAAHYEPAKRVINLTKMNGAGTLSHEWGHALDHALAKSKTKDATQLLSQVVSGKRKPDPATDPIGAAMHEVVSVMLRKSKEVAVDQNVENVARDRAWKTVDQEVARIRKMFTYDESNDTYRTRKRKPATEEQIKLFDAIAKDIVEGKGGDFVDMKLGQGRMAFTYKVPKKIVQLNDLFKLVRGRSLLLSESASIGMQLMLHVRRANEYDARVASLDESSTQSYVGSTEFFQSAKLLDKPRSSSYYAKTDELFARAFEAYVTDKLKSENRESQYLVHGADNSFYARKKIEVAGDFKPYPEGDERVAINAAFDKLFDVLRQDVESPVRGSGTAALSDSEIQQQVAARNDLRSRTVMFRGQEYKLSVAQKQAWDKVTAETQEKLKSLQEDKSVGRKSFLSQVEYLRANLSETLSKIVSDSGTKASTDEPSPKPEPGTKPEANPKREPAEKVNIDWTSASSITKAIDQVKKSGTAEELKKLHAEFVDRKEIITEFISKKYTVDKLKQYVPMMRNKADGVKQLVNAIENLFNVKDGGTVSYDPFKGSYSDALRKAISEVTDADLEAYRADVQKREAAKIAEKEATEKALENPETLEEFRTFVRKKGRESLSADQLARYDDLVAREQTAKAQQAKEVDKTVRGVSIEEPLSFTTKDIIHTKSGETVTIAQPSARVSKESYAELLSAAKKLGGYYSSFGPVENRGFLFKTKDAAEQFIKVASGETVRPDIESKAKVSQTKASSTLRDMADNLEYEANQSLNQDRRTNTARQSRMAGNAEADARSKIAFAKTMRAIADAIESGDAEHLAGIRTKAQIEELQSVVASAKYKFVREAKIDKDTPISAEMMSKAEFPMPYILRSTMTEFEQAKVPGTLNLIKTVRKLAKADDEGNLQIVGWEGVDAWKQIISIIKDKRPDVAKGVNWAADVSRVLRLKSAGIETPAQLRAAAREYVSLMSDAPKADPIAAAERALKQVKIPGFFPTPKPIVERMVIEADIQKGMSVLEPSAGKGDIAEAIRAEGIDPDVVEYNSTLSGLLQQKGFKIVGDDALQTQGEYDRIVMNPPFENGADMDHVRYAFENNLKPGGKLVAIMSEGPFFRSDKKATEFRDWLESNGGSSDKLPDGSFKDSFNSTGVNTRIVTIEKPVRTSAADPAPKVEPVEAKGKEPWEMTRDEKGLTPISGIKVDTESKPKKGDTVVHSSGQAGVIGTFLGESKGLKRIQTENGVVENYYNYAVVKDAPTSDAIKKHFEHNRNVEQALSKGKQVPLSVLKELYPWANKKPADSKGEFYHKMAVETALKEGKPVPAEVLADYSDLAAKYGDKETPAPEPIAAKVVRDVKISTPNRERFAAKLAVVELDDLQPSHLPDGSLNPRFNAEVNNSQNRDRSAPGAVAQIAKRASKPDIEELTTSSTRVDSGVPTVAPDGMGVAGHGRLAILKLIKEKHPKNWEAYQKAVREEYPDMVDGMKDPVLVHVLDDGSPETVERLGRNSNEAVSDVMTAVEIAKGDAAEELDKAKKELRAIPPTTGVGAFGGNINPVWVEKLAKVVEAEIKYGIASSEEFFQKHWQNFKDLNIDEETFRKIVDAAWEKVTGKAKIEDAPVPERVPGESTGLANRVQDAEAESGVIGASPRGVGAKKGYGQKEGARLVTEGLADPDLIADQIVQSGRAFADEVEVGVLLEGKRVKMKVRDQLRKSMEDAIESGIDTGEAINRFESAQRQLEEYIDKVQNAKTKTSDAFRALQEGVRVEDGSFDDILASLAAKNDLKRKDLDMDSPEVKRLEALVKERDAELEKLQKANEALIKAKAEAQIKDRAPGNRRGSGTRSPEVIRKDLDAAKTRAREALQNAVKNIGSTTTAGAGLGSFEGIGRAVWTDIPEVVKAVKDIIILSIEARNVTTLDQKFYDAVREELPDFDLSDSDIRSVLAGEYDQQTRSRSELAQRVQDLKTMARVMEEIDRIMTGKDEPMNSKTRVPIKNAEIEKLRALLKSLKPKATPDRALRIQRTIDELEAMKVGKYRKLKKKTAPPYPEDIRKMIGSLRRDIRMEDSIADLQEQLRTGEFKTPDKKVQELTVEQEKQNAKIKKLRTEIRARIKREKAPDMGTRIADYLTASVLSSPIARVMDVTANTWEIVDYAARNPIRVPMNALVDWVFGQTASAGKEQILTLNRLRRSMEGFKDSVKEKTGTVLRGEDFETEAKYDSRGSFVTRIVGLTDVPYSEAYYRQAIDNLAEGEARHQLGKGASKADIDARTREIAANPSDEMVAVANDWTLIRTFNNDNLSGRIQRAIVPTFEKIMVGQFGERAKTFGKVVGILAETPFRFSKVIANLTVGTARYLPPVAAAEIMYRGLMMKSAGYTPVQARLIADVASKGIVGMALLLAGEFAYDNGEVDVDIIETENGTRFVDYGAAVNFMGGSGKIFMFGAVMKKIDQLVLSDDPEVNERQKQKLREKAAIDIALSQPLLSGMGSVSKAFEDMKSAEKLGGRVLSTVIPYSGLMTQAAKIQDSIRSGNPPLKERRVKSETFGDEFKKKIPFLRETLPTSKYKTIKRDGTEVESAGYEDPRNYED